MATFIREHSPDDFAALLAELDRKPLPINYDRREAGRGRSQAFGVQRRWSYRPYLSRNCWMRPELWEIVQALAAKWIDGPWDACQVNDSYISGPHCDKGNRGESYTVTFGDFTGGRLCLDISGETVMIDTRLKGYTFNGSKIKHWTEPFEGRRLCLVFYQVTWPTKFLPVYDIQTRRVADGLEVTDGYDGSVMVIARSGKVARIVTPGLPREWLGKLSVKGQRSRLSNIPVASETSSPVSHPAESFAALGSGSD